MSIFFAKLVFIGIFNTVAKSIGFEKIYILPIEYRKAP